MPVVSRERLVELEAQIFEQGQRTVEEAASEFSRADLIETIRAARRSLRETLHSLPDSAFEAQPPNEAGEPEWSAGEIVAHLTQSMLRFQFGLRRMAGENLEGEPTGAPELAVLDRAATLALLDRADREFDHALAMAENIDDSSRTELGPLGSLGPRGLLLLHAMHEWDHAGQTVVLGNSDATRFTTQDP